MSTSTSITNIPESSDSEPENSNQTEQLSGDAQPSSLSKKKKKKRSKKSKIPQEIVDKVAEKVKEEHGADSEAAKEENIRLALEHLKLREVMEGKAGLGGINRKDMGEHKFWATQPVPQSSDDQAPTTDGPIEPSVPRDQVRQEPYPLPKEFEWSVVDINDPNQLKELYELLSLHYVEDDEAAFRFNYSAEFLEWALKPPGYHPEWHIGVRVSSNKKLVAFISGVPITLKIRSSKVQASEINYLCIHKKLRSKRLTPVLIKEVTRQCNLKGIFQAIYTVGVVLPTPVSVCRYFHRSLNIPKLVDVNFTYVPRHMTVARMVRQHKVPPSTSCKGLREMEDRDVTQVHDLFSRYMQRFTMIPLMSVEELRHNLLKGKGVGESVDGRKQGQVTWTYVVENSESQKITDFFSFYSLPSTIIGNTRYPTLEAAYMFYYATDVAFSDNENVDQLVKARTLEIFGDALVVANNAKFDVFNALTLLDNVPILKDLKFGEGNGFLNFYLYNWKTAPLAGVSAATGVDAGRGVGVVML
jgi:glycylpeptide N-tetradecanoyltransferase